MKIHIVSLFPCMFTSFFSASLIGKAQESEVLTFNFINPRDFCSDKHQQIDDKPYGGGEGMLLKAEPLITSIEHIISGLGDETFHILFPKPSEQYFTQKDALTYSSIDNLIFVCGRYEGIDHRFDLWLTQQFPQQRSALSLGQYVLLGGEVASMTMIEAIVRLVPGVIKEQGSRQKESYDPLKGMANIEHPQYTRPQEVRGMQIPEVLISGNEQAIIDWRKDISQH